MFRLFPIIIILQIYCIYHAVKNNADQKWYWLIIVFPFFGSLIYLYNNFYSRSNVEMIAEGVKEVVNNGYKLEKLEKEYRFNDCVVNTFNLADAYVYHGRYSEAIELYEKCLDGYMSDSPELFTKLLNAHYLNEDYELVVEYAQKLENNREFNNSFERTSFAWALYYLDKLELAEKTFESMDANYSNYEQRIEYCKFLIQINKLQEAKEKLEGMLNEFEFMEGYERRSKKHLLRAVKNLYHSINIKETA